MAMYKPSWLRIRSSKDYQEIYVCLNYANAGSPIVLRGYPAQGANYAKVNDLALDILSPRSEATIAQALCKIFPGVRSVGTGKARRFLLPSPDSDMFVEVSPEKLTSVVLDVLRGIYTWAVDFAATPGLSKPERAQAASFVKWCEDNLGSVRVRHVVALWGDVVAIPEGDVDADDRLVGSPLGVVDPETGTLVTEGDDPERGAAAHITKSVRGLVLCGKTYGSPELVPEPRWEAFVLESMRGDRRLAAYLQKLLGYAAFGGGRLDKLVIFYGPTTRNGKTTLLLAVRHALGDYAVKAKVELFCKGGGSSRASDANEALQSLKGKRLITTSELKHDARLDEAFVKEVTGGDEISNRGIYGHEETFPIDGTVVIDTNHLPQVEDETIFDSDRVIVVPFENHVPKERRDTTLRDRFRTQRGATTVLSWLLEGYALYLQEGLEEPPAVRMATAEYKLRRNSVVYFVEKRCELDPSARTPIGDLKDAYAEFCDEEDLERLGTSAVKKALHELGVRETRTSAARYYQGVRIL